jgi:hypothetical protein
MNDRSRAHPPRPLPARTGNTTGMRSVATRPHTAPHPAEISSPTTIIPGVARVYDRLRPGQAARRRRLQLAIGAGGLAVILLVVLVVARAHPWTAHGATATVDATTASQPVASGEHDFVCAALPFARLAQSLLTADDNAQPHPWYLSVILAQWGVEGHWATPGLAGYNWSNAPALKGYPAIPGPRAPGARPQLAYTSTAETGVKLYVATIKAGSYAAVATAYPAGPQAQAVALGQSNWAADHYTDTGHPGSALLDTIAYYHLDRFDKAGATC